MRSKSVRITHTRTHRSPNIGRTDDETAHTAAYLAAHKPDKSANRCSDNGSNAAVVFDAR